MAQSKNIVCQQKLYLRNVCQRISTSELYNKDVAWKTAWFTAYSTEEPLQSMSLRGWLSSVISLLITSHLMTVYVVKEDVRFALFLTKKETQLLDLQQRFVTYFAQVRIAYFSGMIGCDISDDEFYLAVSGFEEFLKHPFFDGIFCEEFILNSNRDYLKIVELLDQREVERLSDLGPPPPGPWDKDKS